MYKTAYGFNLSSNRSKFKWEYNNRRRNTRLYYPKNYIDVDKMRDCRLRNNDLGIDANDIC